MKDHIHENICLAYFKPNAKTTIQVDASMSGLGATLINDNKIVAFASKRLTDTESRYANIERELLAVVFGCERFHTYVYRKVFQIESDHKPRENIQNKNIAQASPRLQRMLIRLQPYDAQILYKPGKEMRIPDYLSKTQSTQGEEIELDLTIYIVDITLQKQIELQEATEEDEELKILKQVIVNGWPEDVKDTPILIRNYWSMKDCLSVQNGLVTKGECIVIPKSMQNTVLKRIHDAHQRIEKCQLKARNSVYWRGINKDIEMMVRSCEICREHQRKNTKETMIIKEHSTRPFQNIAADIFEFNGQQILLVADQYSKMPFVKTMKSVMNTSCIEYLKAICAVHGIPERLYTDNAKYFVSNEFHNFAIEWEFTHITSSPRYPQSNGFIERMVQTIKNTLKKAKQSKMDYQMALLCLRTTPLDNHLPLPAEILYNRKIRTMTPTLLDKNTVRDNIIRERMSTKSRKQQQYFNRNAKDLPELMIGSKESVFQENDTWQRATVVDKCTEPRSYIVKMHSDGKLFRRNRRHLQEICSPLRRVTFNLPAQRTSRDEPTSPSQQSNDPTEIDNTNTITQHSHPIQQQTQPDKIQEQPPTPTNQPLRTRNPLAKYRDFIIYK